MLLAEVEAGAALEHHVFYREGFVSDKELFFEMSFRNRLP